ncbi:MAG: prepilin-type N-terminal cleavage/methylation domain-containing protein [Candidatus Omnitrophica bacterium]|nr:prepilin-type N-terminal cleavage/methylation domain-containing protein [Candidatus Omnitrophota bacterium]
MIKITLNKKAFSLIEIMMAVAVLTIAIIPFLLAILNGILLIDSSRNLVCAANDAQYVLEEMKTINYANLSTYTPPTFNNLNNETVTLDKNIGATISTITVNINWQETERVKNISIATCFAQ